MGYRRSNLYKPYVSVAEKRAKAEKKLAKLKKKNPDIKPVIIEGSAIASSWWGKSWNRNLEGYADYSNRISRGRSYVRSGAVLDLKITSGAVHALVQGSRAKPYEIKVEIDPVPPAVWEYLKKESGGQLDSLQELLVGKFPKAVGKLFTDQGKGLFPTPGEIDFSCSCPDYASMCKHVAAVLYGIGARLDNEPELFFTLRNVEIKDLVSRVVKGKSRELLAKAEKKTSRVIDDADLSAMFGIQLEEPMGSVPPAASLQPSKKAKSKVPSKVKKAAKQTALSRVKKANVALAKPKGKEKSVLPIDVVAGIIIGSKEGVDAIELRHKTGLEAGKIYALIYKLKKEGRIKNLSRGFYIGC
ncbi:MAG: hypothetical protein GY757_16845 [bacterium]|nr:hypothetical protein [bacterium]